MQQAVELSVLDYFWCRPRSTQDWVTWSGLEHPSCALAHIRWEPHPPLLQAQVHVPDHQLRLRSITCVLKAWSLHPPDHLHRQTPLQSHLKNTDSNKGIKPSGAATTQIRPSLTRRTRVGHLMDHDRVHPNPYLGRWFPQAVWTDIVKNIWQCFLCISLDKFRQTAVLTIRPSRNYLSWVVFCHVTLLYFRLSLFFFSVHFVYDFFFCLMS